MHVFLHQLGESGMKFDMGSSRFLVAAVCMFTEPGNMEPRVT